MDFLIALGIFCAVVFLVNVARCFIDAYLEKDE